MAINFRFNFANPVTNTATLITFVPDELPFGTNVLVRVHGSSMTYNPGTGQWTGTITSLDLFDVTGGQVLQTVIIDAAQTGNIATNITALLTATIATQNQLGPYFAGADDILPTWNQAGTQITLDLVDSNQIVIGKVIVIGTGLVQNVATGTVTSVEHLNASGNPFVPPQIVDYSANPIEARILYHAFGMDEVLYQTFVTGNDQLTSTAFSTGNLETTFEGGAGNDTFTAGPNGGYVDYASATAAVTVNVANPAAGTATGGAGNDILINIGGIGGSSFADTIIGVNIAPVNLDTTAHYQGGDGNDTILGGAANELITGDRDNSEQNPGNDSVNGGAGNDTIDFSMATGEIVMTLNATGGATVTATGIGTDIIDNFENVAGGSGNDSITGNSSDNIISGAQGNDTLTGGGGSDTVSYGLIAGFALYGAPPTSGVIVNLQTGTATDQWGNSDILSGFNNATGFEFQNNNLTGNGNANVLRGGTLNDSIDGGIGSDTLIGGNGNDNYYIDTYLDVVVENANEGNADAVHSSGSYIMAANIEYLVLTGVGLIDGLGNDENNTILGNNSRNGITGGGGNDTITGLGGDDAIDGGVGADSMIGGTGVDTYYVDNVGDQVVETEVGPALYDTVWTNLANYTLPANVEIYIAINGAGSINGEGNDLVTLMLGNEGNNILNSYAGDDIILGRDGNDTINGGTSNVLDVISGGVGADSLTGGGGHDYFNYELITHGGDTITDFQTFAGGEDDILDLRPMFPTFTNTGGVTTVAQAVTSGHLTFTQAGANTQVFADADGGGNNNVLMATLLNTTAANIQTYTLI